MLKMVDGTGIIGVDMVCPLGGAVSPPQPPNFDKVEMEGVGSLTLPNSLKAPLERVELIGNSVQGENPAPDNPQEIKSAGKYDEASGKYLLDVKVTGKNLFDSRYASNPFNWVDSGDGFKTLNKPLITNGEEYTISSIKLLPKGLGFNFLISESFDRLSVKHYYFYHNGNSPAIKDRVTVRGSDNLYLKMTGDFDSFASNLLNILQFEKGGNKTAYQPYTEQSVQIALDVPLMSIVRITDGKNVQESLNSSGITRRFKEVEITKNARILTHLGNYGAPEINSILARYPDASLKKAGAVLCEELKFGNTWNSEEESVSMTEQGIDFRLSRERLGLGSNTTPEENKVAVIKYLEKHPLHCIAELNEPITEPLPESVQAQLSSLHTENGTTHINIDSGEVECGIKLTYRKEI